jgi:argininosuccinate lyase
VVQSDLEPGNDMKLWGGRFSKEADQSIEAFTASLPFDQRMAAWDIRGSVAHAKMLGHVGILTAEEAAKIVAGLEEIAAEIASGARPPGAGEAEDIHSLVEQRLRERIGPLAGKLHTARSRNDQVATDTRLYLMAEAEGVREGIRTLQEAILRHAEAHVETVLPGLTHMQHAQPVVLAHHLLAYFWMLCRDRERLDDWQRRADLLPLGSGALAGTPFPIDREFVARELGFGRVGENSIDGVADRDFVIELAAALALLMTHLSRLAEEVALWATREFGYLELDDSVATGSSIMPQKKNPDVAELVRGKGGRVTGNLMALLMTMKGLPLAYNSDMQEDKERVFDSIDTATGCLAAMTTLLATARFRSDRMRRATEGDFSTATDLADYLVRQGLPFREAHEVVGRIVRWCEEQSVTLESLDNARLATFSEHFTGAPEGIASVDASVRSRTSAGGTAPDAVRRQLTQARAWLATQRGPGGG